MIQLKAISIFIVAGLLEIGGCYLIWMWLRKGFGVGYGILGAIILTGCAIVTTFQSSSFGRVSATYGAFFIVMSLVWAYYFDNFKPDRYDIIGSVICVSGAMLIYYAPRT
ncbi:MAG TPA: YnfA family protein [Cyclobacteriaceae bacterium]|nr:YnfA family protein [Cyclobacteriaceae bacterium]